MEEGIESYEEVGYKSQQRKAELMAAFNVTKDKFANRRSEDINPSSFRGRWLRQYLRNHGENTGEGNHHIVFSLSKIIFTPFLMQAIVLAKDNRNRINVKHAKEAHLGRVMNPLEALALSLIHTSVLMNDRVKSLKAVGGKGAIVAMRALQVAFNAVVTTPAFLLALATTHAWRLMSMVVSAVAATAVATVQTAAHFFKHRKLERSGLAAPLVTEASYSRDPVIEL